MSSSEQTCGTGCGDRTGDQVTEDVKDYYGKKLQTSQDLKTNACAFGKSKMPKHVREAMALVNEKVSSKYYGCGLIVPEMLEGTRILDLGSGSGQDCFVLSKLVGEKGHVTGLDMTEEQLEVAKSNIQWHMEKFGYNSPNVDFVKGYIEKLGEAGLKDNMFDIVVSNCVVNLSHDKRAVLSEACRVLKVGGEFYFSDMYADRELSEEIRKHGQVLWGEGLSGALHWVTLCKLAGEIGFSQPRLVTARAIDIYNEEIKKLVGDTKYVAATYRLFKLPKDPELAKNVTYKGSIVGCEDKFDLDHHVSFPKGEPVFVDSEVSTILWNSRFKDQFTFEPESRGSEPCPPSQGKDKMDPFVFVSGKP